MDYLIERLDSGDLIVTTNKLANDLYEYMLNNDIDPDEYRMDSNGDRTTEIWKA